MDETQHFSYQSSEQVELEKRARNGDENALADLFANFRSRLRRVVDTRMDTRLKGRIDASDILQDVYVDLAQKFPDYLKKQSTMSLFVWMRLVTNERVLITHRRHFDAAGRDVRREQKQTPVGASSVFLAENLLGVFGSAENRVLRNEMFEVLRLTLESMEAVDHEIITMRCFEELTNAEAAEALGISPNGASSRFVRAMTRLRKELDRLSGISEP